MTSTSATLILAAALTAAALPISAAASPASVERGRRLAQAHCKACHTIAGRKASPVAGAPPFAEFQQRSPERGLDEIFADGMASSHPPMPNFLASAGQRQDLLDYVRSVQAPAPR